MPRHRQDNPDARLARALSDIQGQYGSGAVLKGDDRTEGVEVIYTGALTLDFALGVGGLPRGRIVEVYGPEGSGKTTLALQVVANAQRLGGKAVYIDAEHALDMAYAARLGVDRDELLFSQPGCAEEALDITRRLVESDAVDVVVVDSVAALVPKAELEGQMGDSHLGLQARLMSQAMRKLVGLINRTRTIVIFINQIRYRIGVQFGNPETTPGGQALKFAASVRLDVRRQGRISEGDTETGMRVRVKVVKNKVSPPHRKAELDIMYAEGISWSGGVFDEAERVGLVTSNGSQLLYGQQQLGQGRENAKRFLKETPQLMLEIENGLRRANGLPERPWGSGPEVFGAVGELPGPDEAEAG